MNIFGPCQGARRPRALGERVPGALASSWGKSERCSAPWPCSLTPECPCPCLRRRAGGPGGDEGPQGRRPGGRGAGGLAPELLGQKASGSVLHRRCDSRAILGVASALLLDALRGSEGGRGVSGVLVQVYRSPRRADTYLLTEKASGLTAVPEALFGTFGDPEPAFVFHLTAGTVPGPGGSCPRARRPKGEGVLSTAATAEGRGLGTCRKG